MKCASVGSVVLLAAVLTACGGHSSSSSAPTTSGLVNRAFVSNGFSGANSSEADTILVIDATKDQLSNIHPLIGGLSAIQLNVPSLMALSPNHDITVVFNAGNNSVAVVQNGTESLGSNTISLGTFTESMIVKDATTAYAALPNANVGTDTLGGVVILDLKNFAITKTIPVPRARRIVVNHAGTKLAAFSDNADSVSIIDIAGQTATQVAGFDRAVNGVFSLDDSTLFVTNCGPECGGTIAGVQPLDMASGAAGAAVPVPAATVALLNGSTLYVAGTAGGVLGNGKLSVLTVSGNVPQPPASAGVSIGDGFHTRMAVASNNKLFIGALNCTNDPQVNGTGCLSIFDTAANTAVVDVGRGNVTGMDTVAGRNVVYVCEGGELRIYDTTTSQLSTGAFIDVIGNAVDVKLVDQPQQMVVPQ